MALWQIQTTAGHFAARSGVSAPADTRVHPVSVPGRHQAHRAPAVDFLDLAFLGERRKSRR